ncbi:MAG: hypothetical protein ACE37M_13675 [Henriciella sp.]
MALSFKGAGQLLVRIPTALFPIALGLAGLASAAIIAAPRLNLELLNTIGMGVLCLAGGILVVDVLLYLIKLLRHSDEVAEDLSTANRANLLAPGLMAAMVIGGTLADAWSMGGVIWAAASVLHVILLIGFVGRWLTHDYAPSDLNPTWFLPAAGIMTSGMTWPGIGPVEFPLLTFGIGVMVWVMLLPLVFRRLVFEPAVAPELRPSLFIAAAPFGLAAGALLTLFPNLGWHAPNLLLSGGAFFIAVLLLQLNFIRKAGITLSWWATTFPIATVAAGYFRISDQSGNIALYAAMGLLIVACFTTSFALIATVRATWCTCAKTVRRTEQQIEAMQGLG